MKKKLFSILLCSILVVCVTGCGNKTELSPNKNNSTEKTKKVESKGKCDIFKCIEKASTSATLEDMNKLIGFEGKQLREGQGWNTYEWALNEDDTVEVTFYSSDSSATIKIKFDDERIKNKKVDFSKLSELKKALSNREEVSYDTVKEKFGGVDGTMIEKSKGGFVYKWVNSEGGYMNAHFNGDKTKCTMMMGRN